MKKVAFLINTLIGGGAEKVLIKVITELEKEGFFFELFVLEKKVFKNNFKGSKITYLSNMNGKENGFIKLASLPIIAHRLKKIIRKNKIELVQSHIFRANFINALTRLLGSQHEVQVVNHGLISHYETKSVLGSINILLAKVLYKKVDLQVFVSRATLLDFINKSVPINQYVIIHNPFDILEIEMKSKMEVFNFNFKKDKTFIVAVGRVISLKRYDDLISALSLLESSVELIIVGDGSEVVRLKNLAISLNISHRVHFIGQVENPFNLIRKADILTVTSESESFCNVIVESFICETIVISTDCGGPKEIFSDMYNCLNEKVTKMTILEYGILIPIGDICELVKAINKVLENKKLSINLLRESKKRANNFSVKKSISSYKKVLKIEP